MRTRWVLASIIGSATAALIACEPGPPENGDRSHGSIRVDVPAPDQPIEGSDTVAVVNGQPVSGYLYRMYARARHEQQRIPSEPNRHETINELVNLILLAQHAQQQGLAKRPELAARLRFQRDNMLAQALLEQVTADLAPTREEIRDEYQTTYAGDRYRAYKTRSILVERREDAERIIRELDNGADFAELARNRSIGPAAETGGALEWFTRDSVLPRFAEAVESLEKGAYTTSPVRTRYGWHVILLEDTRPAQPPPFEEVRDKIEQALVRQRLSAYVANLRETASVTIPGNQSDTAGAPPPATPAVGNP